MDCKVAVQALPACNTAIEHAPTAALPLPDWTGGAAAARLVAAARVSSRLRIRFLLAGGSA